jgi:hypothetical protein
MQPERIGLLTAIADAAIFFEFSGNQTIDPDAAVGALEQLVYVLLQVPQEARIGLSRDLTEIATHYDVERRKFVNNLAQQLL